MLLPYEEYKEAVIETYEGLYKKFGYSLSDAFYSLLHDFENDEKYCEIDSLLFYMFYADICLTNNENIDFMKANLLKLISDDYLLQLEKGLGKKFEESLLVVKRIKDSI